MREVFVDISSLLFVSRP